MSKLFSHMFSFVGGIYIAQNYSVPSVKNVIENLVKKIEEMEKESRKR